VRRGSRWPGRYLWRATLLLLDGAINYVLVAEFDVLMGYAVTGAIIAYLLLTRPRTQRALIVVFGGLHLLLISAIVAGIALSGANGELPLPNGRNPYADGSFLDLALFRLENLVLFRAEPVLIGLLSLALFLLGAQEPGSSRRRARACVVACSSSGRSLSRSTSPSVSPAGRPGSWPSATSSPPSWRSVSSRLSRSSASDAVPAAG
jgi:hypothetical protein